MGWNDRAREAALVLRHGGTIPEPEVRAALIEWFTNSGDGWASGPPRDLATAIREVNRDIYDRVCSGELQGLYDDRQENQP